MVLSIIALILLVGTVGIGLTYIARTEQYNLREEVAENADQVAVNRSL